MSKTISQPYPLEIVATDGVRYLVVGWCETGPNVIRPLVLSLDADAIPTQWATVLEMDVEWLVVTPLHGATQ